MTLPHTKVKALKRRRGRGKSRGGPPFIEAYEKAVFTEMVKRGMFPRRFVLQDLAERYHDQ